MSGLAAPSLDDAARFYRTGDFTSAERCALAIVAAAPRHFDALHLLGVLCLNAHRFADAASWLSRAAGERRDVAQLHYHLGNALLGLKLFDTAQTAFRTSLQLRPHNADVLNNLGNALAGAGHHRQAIDCFHEALAVRSNAPATLFNLARSLVALGDYRTAEPTFRAALAFGHDAPADQLANVCVAYCHALIDQEKYDQALDVCRNVPPALFGHPVVEWNEALTRLMLGDYKAGWRLYARRFEVAEHDRPRTGARLLDLDAVAGKRVLVFGEQGRGDIIQFARYLPLLAQLGAVVLAEIYPDLGTLLGGMTAVTAVVEPDSPTPEHDLLTPLLDLPHAFGTELASVPADVPYLQPPDDRLRAWSARLGPPDRPRVAVTWWSAQDTTKRSMPAFLLAPLLGRQDVEWHAVQKGITTSDADWLARNPSIQVHDDTLHDFADTAALLQQMDLVISIDTVTAHVAGALGRPLWIMLPYSPDWRWLHDRSDSPWYPTARLFRQARGEGWAPVVARVAEALQAYDFTTASHRLSGTRI